MVIESECGVHDNTETCYLIRDIDLGVSNFNRWYGRKSAKALMGAESIALDLSGLRQKPLKQSHDCKADRHVSKRSTDLEVSLRVRPMYSCASSAYC